MSDLIWLSPAQIRRIAPCFPLSHGIPRVDGREIFSRITSSFARVCAGAMRRRRVAAQDDLRSLRSLERPRHLQRDLPKAFGQGPQARSLDYNATHLKAHRTAASLLKHGLFPEVSDAPKAA